MDRQADKSHVSDIVVSTDSVASLATVYRENLEKRCSKQHGLKKARVEVYFKQNEDTMIVVFSGKDVDDLVGVTKNERFRDRVKIMGLVAEAELVELFPLAVRETEGFEKDSSGRLTYKVVLKINR
jgi:hypothetical protein